MKKTILITGSTDGIGKLATAKLAKDGHELIIHGRNETKVNSTVLELKQNTSNENIIGVTADLSTVQNVNKLSLDLKKQFDKIDVLVNNAGVFLSKQSNNKAGIDLRFMVNYIAPNYLTRELLPLMKKSEEPRIINLSSAAQETVSIKALTDKEKISVQSAYAQSKLALTMWSFQLGKELSDLTVIPVNPGSLLNTKMVQEAYGKFWSSADKGANIIQLLATDPKYKGLKGKYFDNDLGNPLGDFGKAHMDAYNQELIDQLITQTDQLIDSIK